MVVARVLVTGASGFIGRHVVRALLAAGGHAVHAASRHPPVDGPEPGAVYHPVDLLAEGAVVGLVREVRPSHLLHLAWNAVPGQFWRAPDNLDWVAASLRLYRAFAEAGGQRAVFAGSCAEYDWGHGWLDEAVTPRRPATLYGVAKSALHDIVAAAANADGVSLAWARLFFLYGPHEPPGRLVPDVILSLLGGQPALCGTGRPMRDFMHVEDVAGALIALLDSDYAGPVNIASGQCVPLAEVVLTIADFLGRRDLVRFGARLAPPGEPEKLAASTAILQRGIGFVPRHSLEAGLAATIGWWQSRLPDIASEE